MQYQSMMWIIWNCSGRVLPNLKEDSISFLKLEHSVFLSVFLRLAKRFGSKPKDSALSSCFESCNNWTQASRQIIGCLGNCTVVQGKNWAYVVLSRVWTLAGLFLTHLIPDDIDFMPSVDYLEKMENLRKTILATPDQVETLKSNFNPDSLF